MAPLPRISSDTRTGTTTVPIWSPDTPSSAYSAMSEDWDVIRTVYAGTRALRQKGETYLPKHPVESQTEYDRRLQATTLTNILRDTIQNTASRPFRKRIGMTEGAPEVAKLWADDIDLMGKSLHMVAIRAFRECMLDGMVHVLVDMNAIPAGASASAERALRARPFWTVIPARSLIAAYTRINDDGEKIVYHARVKEMVVELDGFTEVQIERVTVYKLVKAGDLASNPTWAFAPEMAGYEGAVWEKWERQSAGWLMLEGGPMLKAGQLPWDRVPLETFYAGSDIGDFTCTPPFIDLAWKNVEHWQSSSDQRNILTKGRFPMLAAAGIEDISKLLNEKGEMQTGPHVALITPDPNVKWYYVEPTGSAIKAGAEDLKQLIEDMRIMGLDPLLPQNTGEQTATEAAVDEAKARAPLEQWAWEFADFISRCFDRMFEWVGLTSYIGLAKVLLDTDIGLGNEKDGDLQILLQLRQMRDLSRRTLFEELQRRGLLSPYFDADNEEQFIEDELITEMSSGFDPRTGAPPPEFEDGADEDDDEPDRRLN